MKPIFFVVVLSVMVGQLSAQERSARPLTVTMFNEGVSYPFSQVLTLPIHPGLMVETYHVFREGKHGSWRWEASVGYYYHRHFAQGIFVQGQLAYRYQTKAGIYFQPHIGVGYLHVFRTAPSYALRDGKYERRADRGSGKVMPSFSLEIGQRLKPKQPLSPEIFVRYQTWLQYPFSPGFIPLLSHTNLHLGYTCYPFQK